MTAAADPHHPPIAEASVAGSAIALASSTGTGSDAAVGAGGPAAAGPLHGRAAFVEALRRSLLGLDGAAGAAMLVMRDRDFQPWPLGEVAVLDALTRWLRPPGRGLTLIGADFAALAGQHPRFARWRRDWVHRVAAWTPTEPAQADLRALLLAPRHAVQLLETLRWRGRVVVDRAQLQALHEQCDAQTQRSQPAWPATTLGL